jgi:hypothetical protein
MMTVLRDLLLIALVVAGGLGASQVPSYMQEYEQRLGGARDEAVRQSQAFHRVAQGSGLSFEDYLATLLGKPEQAVRQTGERIRDLDARAAALAVHATALADTQLLLKPLVALEHGDADIARAAWDDFRLTLTLDTQFGLLGAAVGWLLALLLNGVLGVIAPAPRRYRR